MKIRPDVAAGLLADIPPRLVKKLDAEPAMAKAWTWSDAAVVTAKGETVTFAIADGAIAGVTCSCLLSPKCLHVAAVVTALEVADASPPPESVVVAAAEPAEPAAAPVAEAAAAFGVLAGVLATGAESTGAFAQAELMRVIHACRGAGLHRLAAAQTRVLRSIRDLRADRPEFTLATLAADLREALVVAHALARGRGTPALVGRARRDYEVVGNLRLRGLFTEAVVARSGYAGAVTYLIDDTGALYTRADVAPGDAGRAAGAYDASAAIGDAVLSHRELSRAGLFLSSATASADGRLGAGKDVRAVRASEPARWDDPPCAARWQPALADQLARIAAHDGAPDELRPAGWDLVFVTGTVFGDALVVDGAGGADTALELATAFDHRALRARDNLAVLARGSGVRVRAIARVRLAAPGRLELLAVGPAPGETRLALATALHGRLNVHYDELAVPAPAAAPIAPPARLHVAAAPLDLLEPLRRRVEQIALGGLPTLPQHAVAAVERDAAALVERALRTGAEALRAVATAAHASERAMTGSRRAVDRPAFARAWLRATVYESAARRRLAVASWLAP
jgi:hypothetical protein|nr:hypothetical protein [Kofleriaceae bacterium]